MAHYQDTSLFYDQDAEWLSYANSSTSQKSQPCTYSPKIIYYGSSIMGSLVFFLTITCSIVSLIVWKRLMNGRQKSVGGEGSRSPKTMTPQIFFNIEWMNIVVCSIQYLRHLVPAILTAKYLSNAKGCGVSDFMPDFINNLPYEMEQVLPILWLYTYPIEQGFIMAYQWIHLLLSYERFMYICRPFRAPQKCTKRRMQILLRVIIIASLVCALPFRLEYELYTGSNAYGNVSCTQVVRKGASNHPCYILLYRFLFHISFKYAIPWAIIIYQTAKILKVLIKMNKVNLMMQNLRASHKNSLCLHHVKNMIKERCGRTSVYSISSMTSVFELAYHKASDSRNESRSSSPSITEAHEHLSNRPSCDTLTQLDKVTNNNNQKNITKISVAILIIFMFCQLPRGVLLTKCGLDYEPLYPHFANCLQNIDHNVALNISEGECLHATVLAQQLHLFVQILHIRYDFVLIGNIS